MVSHPLRPDPVDLPEPVHGGGREVGERHGLPVGEDDVGRHALGVAPLPPPLRDAVEAVPRDRTEIAAPVGEVRWRAGSRAGPRRRGCRGRPAPDGPGGAQGEGHRPVGSSLVLDERGRGRDEVPGAVERLERGVVERSGRRIERQGHEPQGQHAVPPGGGRDRSPARLAVRPGRAGPAPDGGRWSRSAQEPDPWRRLVGRSRALAQRKPMSSLRSDGVSSSRLPARMIRASLSKLPPRLTRSEPLGPAAVGEEDRGVAGAGSKPGALPPAPRAPHPSGSGSRGSVTPALRRRPPVPGRCAPLGPRGRRLRRGALPRPAALRAQEKGEGGQEKNHLAQRKPK